LQFQVPQFIDTEDRLIGPLTLKQFIYLAFGAIFVFFFYFVLQFWLWLIAAGIIIMIALALAFFKYNGRPFLILALAILNHFWQPRHYFWQSASETAGREQVSQEGISILGFKLNTFTKPLTDRREKSLKPSLLDRLRGATQEKFEVFRKLTGEKEVARRVDYR
jgi:hypothetical protein